MAEDEEHLTSALEEWIERRLAGETIDPAAFAHSRGLPVDSFVARARGVPSLLARHAGARAALTPGAPDHGEPALGPASFPCRFGRYTLLRELGRGGQGVVYLATGAASEGEIALKVLTGAAMGSEQTRARFRREAEVATRLAHPAICPVLDSGVERGLPYLAMPHLSGATLAATIESERKGGAPPDRPAIRTILGLFETVARALHVAHDAGVIHRDVKPGNILVTPAGQPVILDFGLAADREAAATTLTHTGDLLGTPAYMSPEQLVAPAATVDRRTDVYSLGVTLFERLTLTRPFEAPTRASLYTAITRLDAPDPRRLNPAIDRDLAVVLETAMAKVVGDRYQSALAFADELRRVRGGEPIRARPPGPVQRLHRFAQRNRAIAAAAASIFVILALSLAVTIALLDRTRRERTDKERVLVEWGRLEDLRGIQELLAWSDRLWPAEPERGAEMDEWLRLAAAIEARVPEHRIALDRVLAEDAAAAAPPRFTSARRAGLEKLIELVPQLDVEIARMHERREFARDVDRLSIDEHRGDWDAAIAVAADAGREPGYGISLRPQRGLVPLGVDPDSKLLEFAHLQTGNVPERDAATGKLRIGEGTGLVFVLLPGGTFSMGASLDPAAADYDQAAEPMELPAHMVTLGAFLLSKYEMTQGQWLRVARSNPSVYHPAVKMQAGTPTLRHPVESVSAADCAQVLGRFGLSLPTEAQWEYACRGGTRTSWWTGDTVASLAGAANIADEGSRRFFYSGWVYERRFRDGFASHAPVGSFRPNPFGLYDVHGNVLEWCADHPWAYTLSVREGDGLRLGGEAQPGMRVVRGGSYNEPAHKARVSFRGVAPVGGRMLNVGVRPARALQR